MKLKRITIATTVIAIIALLAIITITAAPLTDENYTDEPDIDISSIPNLSHSFQYETLAAHLSDVEETPQEENTPYNGYSHGLDPQNESTDDPSYSDYSGDGVAFSKVAGAYSTSFEVSLRAPAGYSIHYTTDGTDPTPESPIYSKPIQITDEDGAERPLSSAETIHAMSNYDFEEYYVPDQSELERATVIRARAFDEQGNATEISQRTYFAGKSVAERYGGIAVISITSDPYGLVSYDGGIFAAGWVYDQWRETEDGIYSIETSQPWRAQGNYSLRGREVERAAYIEMFDGTDCQSFSSPVGIRVRGATSRAAAQKSLNVYFRKDYGNKKLDYRLFDSVFDDDGNNVSSYKSFVLRNGGTESANGLRFRDSYLQSLLDGMNFSVQASRPAILYLNGEYWGAYMLTERYSDNMIESEYGVDKDNVVIVKDEMIDEGNEEDIALYQDLAAFAERDMTDPVVWEEFKSVMDVSSMADYFAAEIYIGNADWLSWRNTSLWRARTPENDRYGDGRWRYILYDTEFSSGFYPHDGDNVLCDFDHLAQAVVNHPLFAATLRNNEFKAIFSQSMHNIAENKLEYGRCMARLMEYLNVWWPLMPDLYDRYGHDGEAVYRLGITRLADFLERRASFILPVMDAALADYDTYYQQAIDNAALLVEEQQVPDFQSSDLEIDPSIEEELPENIEKIAEEVEEAEDARSSNSDNGNENGSAEIPIQPQTLNSPRQTFIDVNDIAAPDQPSQDTQPSPQASAGQTSSASSQSQNTARNWQNSFQNNNGNSYNGSGNSGGNSGNTNNSNSNDNVNNSNSDDTASEEGET